MGSAKYDIYLFQIEFAYGIFCLVVSFNEYNYLFFVKFVDILLMNFIGYHAFLV